MATLYITEYAQPMVYNGDGLDSPKEPESLTQTVTVGAGSLQSNAFKNNTNFIRLQSDVVCSVLIGTNPTATATSRRLPANVIEYAQVDPSSNMKVAVITNS